MASFKGRIFICSPYRGDVEANTELACKAAREVMRQGYLPIAPHIYFTRFLDDSDELERDLGIRGGIELLKHCDFMLQVGDRVTEGMDKEIKEAKRLGIPLLQITMTV